MSLLSIVWIKMDNSIYGIDELWQVTYNYQKWNGGQADGFYK